MAYPFNITTEAWWADFQADPKAKFKSILHDWGRNTIVSCQYFVSNLPRVCGNWDGNKCTFAYNPLPTGYGGGACDCLGRRYWCNEYIGDNSEDNSDEWVCVAISPERSGVYKDVEVDGKYRKVPIAKTDLATYCESDGGVGLCDGWGCGRQCGEGDLDALLEMPILCKYYRPWSLGFGAIEPQTYERAIRDYNEVYNTSYQEFVTNPLTSKRLPFLFEVFNMRAVFQPCANWHGTPAKFVYSTIDGETYKIRLSVGFGSCQKDPQPDYAIVDDTIPDDVLTKGCWSMANTVICNGAKPECPYYTGEWKYCTDERMIHGMPITALQILELRFWTRDWLTQEEYDEFFERRPNWTDSTTADIYTFTQWEKMDLIDTSKSIMKGMKYSMCMPAPLWNKRFDIETYVTIEEVIYPPLNTNIGTGSENQRQYPTLIGNLWSDYQGELRIIYPYLDKENDMDTQPCLPREIKNSNEYFCERRSNSIDGDFTTVVGYARWAEVIYIININHAEWPPDTHYYNDVREMPVEVKETFYNYMNNNIEELLVKYGSHIITTSSSVQGIFISPPHLPLDYNTMNDILIIAKYPNQTWQYKKRRVFPKFYGGIVAQSTFNFEHGSDHHTPTLLMPKANTSYSPISIGSSTFSECKVLKSFNREAMLLEEPICSSSYTMEIFEEKNIEVEYWTRIGESNYIWIEIDDLNLNYILDWWVESGTFIYTDREGNSITTDLEVVYPIGSNVGDLYRDTEEKTKTKPKGDFAPSKEKLSIPPNACILKTVDTANLVKYIKTAVLTVDYRYYKLCADDEIGSGIERVFPTAPFWTRIESDNVSEFTAEMFNSTVSVMGIFNDEDGRNIVAFSTKLYANINRTCSRNIEMYYSYKGSGPEYQLQPTLGSFADYTGPRKNMGTYNSSFAPPCGDHELLPCDGGVPPGPTWFPFTKCFDAHYNVWAQATFCIDDMERSGPCMNHAGPVEYHAWCPLGDGGGGITCRVPWDYRTAQIQQWEFNGYAKIVASVDKRWYENCGWPLPPFGNYARDFVERYMSKDRASYIDTSGSTSKIKTVWMPAVIDNNSFYLSFNSFDSETTSTYSDCFSNNDQMGLFLNSTVNEQIDRGERIRWEDIFESVGASGWYPEPVVIRFGTMPYGYFYHFKDDNHIWAWQEFWKPIERSLDNKIILLNLIKPSYFYSPLKEEARYITDEGGHTITFTAPEIENGTLIKYPSIAIDEAFPRYFNIIYDDYDSSLIEWMDEGNGEVGVSGGPENIYDQTSGWTHDYHMVFDSTAVITEAEAEANNTFYYEIDLFDDLIKMYYNRGIIVHIQKNSLPFMPITTKLSAAEIKHEVEDVTKQQETPPCGSVEAVVSLNINNVADLSILFEEGGVCIKKIIIEGLWGTCELDKEVYSYCKPTIEMNHITVNSELKPFDNIDYVSPVGHAIASYIVVPYTNERHYTILPYKMLEDRTAQLNISITKPGGMVAVITKISVYTAEYKTTTEDIFVWERKYYPSTGGEGFNAFGTTHDLKGMYDSQGPFFDFTYSTNSTEDEVGHNKIYGVFASPVDIDPLTKKEIGCSKSNMGDIEYGRQRELYMDNAYDKDIVGDDLSYVGVIPPKLEHFVDKIANLDTGFNIPNLSVISKKLSFEDHTLTQSYYFHPFWQPGGHFFEWGPEITRERCYVYKPLLRDIHHVTFNCVRHGAQNQGTMVPLTSYYSGRLAYQNAVFDKFYAGTGTHPGADLLTNAAFFGGTLNPSD